MIENQLEALAQLRAALSQDSCLPKAPMMALEPNATPPQFEVQPAHVQPLQRLWQF